MKITCPHCGSKNTKKYYKPYIIAWCLAFFALICLIGFIDCGWWVAAIIDIILIVGGMRFFEQETKKKKKLYKCKSCEKSFEK